MVTKAISRLLPVSLFAASIGAQVIAAPLALDVEESRLAKAEAELPQVTSRYQAMVDGLTDKYKLSNDELKVTQMAAMQAKRLWQQATRDVQSGGADDRPLYWSRLKMRAEVKQLNPKFKIADWQRGILVKAIESASRGLSDIHYSDDADIKILLTGFDPFFLDRDIGQSNPSGLAALALDGYRFKVGDKLAQVETAMIPVRFADFDQGIIESMLTPVFKKNSIDMVATVSMGRDDFDLERFPGRNRSAKAPGNLNVYTGASKDKPLAPMLDGKTLNGPEFVEFSLPVKAMQSVQGRWKVNDNHTVTTKDRGEFQANSLNELRYATSVEGSGGGYLSNEISYRSILLKQQLESTISVGHIHTPRVKGYDKETELAIVEQIKQMLEAAAQTL